MYSLLLIYSHILRIYSVFKKIDSHYFKETYVQVMEQEAEYKNMRAKGHTQPSM